MVDSGARVPRIAHFVFGLAPQTEPFHLVHYLAIESCRRLLEPERIYLHHKWLPYGVYWDLVRPHVTLVPADQVPQVLGADYDDVLVPKQYRYAHHADFVRLAALIEHGGVYADLDTLFLQPFPDDLFDEPFVIGEEPAVRDERSGVTRPSLCNAVMMSEPGAEFAREWLARMGSALNGTWSNHSGFLARALADELPESVRVEPERTFFPWPCTPAGLDGMLASEAAGSVPERHSGSVLERHRRSVPEQESGADDGALTLHLCAHLWWHATRTDFCSVHAGMLTTEHIRSVDTAYNRLARPFLPDVELW